MAFSPGKSNISLFRQTVVQKYDYQKVEVLGLHVTMTVCSIKTKIIFVTKQSMQDGFHIGRILNLNKVLLISKLFYEPAFKDELYAA